MFGNLFAELDVIKGLTLRTSLGGGYTNSFFKDYNYIYLGDSEPEASYTSVSYTHLDVYKRQISMFVIPVIQPD